MTKEHRELAARLVNLSVDAYNVAYQLLGSLDRNPLPTAEELAARGAPASSVRFEALVNTVQMLIGQVAELRGEIDDLRRGLGWRSRGVVPVTEAEARAARTEG